MNASEVQKTTLNVDWDPIICNLFYEFDGHSKINEDDYENGE